MLGSSQNSSAAENHFVVFTSWLRTYDSLSLVTCRRMWLGVGKGLIYHLFFIVVHVTGSATPRSSPAVSTHNSPELNRQLDDQRQTAHDHLDSVVDGMILKVNYTKLLSLDTFGTSFFSWST